jgi:hypothetical protein
MNRVSIIYIFLFIGLASKAQNIPLNHWRSHMPFSDGLKVVEVGQKIFCATNTGLFYLDKSDNSMHTLSKVDGLSDVFTKTLTYDAIHDLLFIVYQDGDLDMLHHGKIINKNDFLNKNISINSIYTNGALAYVCTNAPLEDAIYEMRLDNPDYELGERYNCNSPRGVNRVTVLGRYLYACSDSGVKRTPLATVNKRDPSQWQHISNDSCSNVVSFGGKVIASFAKGVLRFYDTISNTWTTLHYTGLKHVQSMETGNGKLVVATNDSIFLYNPDLSVNSSRSVQQNDVILDNNGILWVAKNIYAMVSINQSGRNDFYRPSGRPDLLSGNNAFGYHNEVWISGGVITGAGAPSYTYTGFTMFDGESWHNYNPGLHPAGDYFGLAKDTVTNHLWLGSLDSGVVDFDPVTKNSMVYYYGNTNNTLPKPTLGAGITFDKNDNLWCSMYLASKQLARKKPDGTWTVFKAGAQQEVNKILADDYGYIWMIDSRSSSGVNIFDPATGNLKNLSSISGSGGLPSGNVNCIAKDKSGQIWLGTTAGACLYSDPSLLFGNRTYDVQRPYINSGQFQGYLLAAQNVTAIAVDGANRKWFGTSNGVYLTNPEGDKLLMNFNTANSPLVSNQITAIAINGVTGEVFFVTDKGIVSYRGTATDGGEHNQDVYAYPNPVKPGYYGPIAIKGLVNDANVKITDITGQLVYETTALGGQAIWNGNNFSGQRANSGVYMVFITNTDGTETMITKIMIIR